MRLDFFRRAFRDGPDAFGVVEYAKRALACFLHWRLWVGAAMVFGFLWATLPYLASQPAASASLFELVLYHYKIVPWLVGRPLRLLAALPLNLWFIGRMLKMPRY